MSKKGENIYKRKDGRWEGRYIKFYDENFKPKYGYIYGHTYTEVKNKLLVNKADTINETTEVKTVLYSQILEQWLNSVKINVKESTYVRYCSLVNNHILKYLGKYPVSKISTMQIETYIRMQLQSGQVKNAQPLSSKTVNDILIGKHVGSRDGNSSKFMESHHCVPPFYSSLEDEHHPVTFLYAHFLKE